MSLAEQFVECWAADHGNCIHQIDSEWVVINRIGCRAEDAPWLCHCCPSEAGPHDFARIVNIQVGETYRTTKKMKECPRCNAKPTDEIMAVYHLLTLFEDEGRE